MMPAILTRSPRYVDSHVLCAPLAFTLSQDQTLKKTRFAYGKPGHYSGYNLIVWWLYRLPNVTNFVTKISCNLQLTPGPSVNWKNSRAMYPSIKIVRVALLHRIKQPRLCSHILLLQSFLGRSSCFICFQQLYHPA